MDMITRMIMLLKTRSGTESSMAARFGERLATYDALKTQLWSLVDGFTGNRHFGMGDARTLISMAADIAAVEQGCDYVSALAEALNFAHAMATFLIGVFVGMLLENTTDRYQDR
jgi:hypothetical protein